MTLALLAFVLVITPLLLVRGLRPYTPVAIIAFTLGVPLLLTRSTLGRWVANYVGKELEVLPYERLLNFDDSLAYQAKKVDAIDIYFNSELVSGVSGAV